jgi:hypothetical protein
MRKPVIRIATGVALLLLLGACGGNDQGTPSSNAESQADLPASEDESDLFDALAGGGGGMLIVDGEEIPITSATCILDEGSFDAGTVSDNGFRVLATKSRPENDAYAQILDADFVQWFQKDSTGDEVERDENTLIGATATYFNNADDREIEASFTIECP